MERECPKQEGGDLEIQSDIPSLAAHFRKLSSFSSPSPSPSPSIFLSPPSALQLVGLEKWVLPASCIVSSVSGLRIL